MVYKKALIYVGMFFMLSCFFSLSIKAETVCKRPQWKIIYNNILHCKMYYNHFILYETSLLDPIIERKKNFCYVIRGAWRVKSYTKEVTIYHAKELNIDHVLPYNYFVKQLGCNKAKVYFDFSENLEVVEANYNKHKSDTICLDKEECEKQRKVCLLIEKLFNVNLNCKNLN